MRKEQNINISPQAQRELGEILEMVNDILHYSMQMFSTGDDSRLEDIVRLEEAIDRKERQLQNAHVERLARNECTPEAGMIFSDIVSGLERVGDHAMNIAIATLDEEEQIAVHNLKTKIQAENEV